MNDLTTQADSTKVTWSQVYADFKGAIDGAADAMKTGAEHVYQVLVQQQLVKSISFSILNAVLLVLALVTWRITISFLKKKRAEEADLQSYEKGEWGYMYILPGAASILFIITIALTIIPIITGFVNPEYGAIQEIRSFIK
jgi:hypothetical protein